MIKKTSLKNKQVVNKGTFWKSISKPFFVLAPMANVTDFAFRSMIAKYGKPDVMWNEFVSADGLNSAGKERLLVDLKFSEQERPIVAQLFTGHPDAMFTAARLCAELGYDGLDINMGCPDRSVEKQGGGAAHIKDQKNALAVLQAARLGWMGNDKLLNNKKRNLVEFQKLPHIPVSIKTRLGYNKIDFDWLKLLFEQNLPVLTIHLRTRKEMSDVKAHWELMPEIIELRNKVQNEIPINERTLVIGNGDVQTVVEAAEKCNKYKCDGVMIGRGIFGTPWLFADKGKFQSSNDKVQINSKVPNSNFQIPSSKFKTPEQRLEIMLEHAKLFDKTFCGKKNLKNFAVMKKHFKAYVSGWDGAKELRVKLMETNNFKEVKRVVDAYIQSKK